MKNSAVESPAIGTKLRVSTARGIAARRRAGVDFSPTPTTVEVVAPDELAARGGGAAGFCDPAGAAAILGDDGLLSLSHGSGGLDQLVADLRAQLAAKDEELAMLRLELAKRGGLAGENGADMKPDATASEPNVGSPPKPTASPSRRGEPARG